jgi:hypothetical protein
MRERWSISLNALMLFGWGLTAAAIRSEVWRDRVSSAGLVLAIGSAFAVIILWLLPKRPEKHHQQGRVSSGA